jgi:hypothetical protein
MNVIKSGLQLQIYGSEVQTFSEIPVGFYDINFSKMTGFFLQEKENYSIKEERIYGNHGTKINKVLSTFEKVNKNFGVLLSGTKGMGKSLFVKMLAHKGIEQGYPVLIVPNYFPDLSAFISSIQQTVIIIFDEFEKNFPSGENSDCEDCQQELLSLFDGIDNGKKLFALTCNDLKGVNDYFLNRPGRIYYHFKVDSPTVIEIEEYLQDNLINYSQETISTIQNLSLTYSLSYDILKAICAELNSGYGLSETINDLNLLIEEKQRRYNITCYLSDGSIVEQQNYEIGLTERFPRTIYGFKAKKKTDSIDYPSFELRFIPIKCISFKQNELIFDHSEIDNFMIDEDCSWRYKDEEWEYITDKFKTISIDKIEIVPVKTNDNFSILI